MKRATFIPLHSQIKMVKTFADTAGLAELLQEANVLLKLVTITYWGPYFLIFLGMKMRVAYYKSIDKN